MSQIVSQLCYYIPSSCEKNIHTSLTCVTLPLFNHARLLWRWTECGAVVNMIWHHRGMCGGCSDCACVLSGPSHAPMQQQSGQVQSAIPSTSLSLPASSYGSSVPGYSHAAPSSQGSMIQGPGPGYGSSSSSSSTSSSSSSSSRSNLNMHSNQGEPGIVKPSHQELVSKPSWSDSQELPSLEMQDAVLVVYLFMCIIQDLAFRGWEWWK